MPDEKKPAAADKVTSKGEAVTEARVDQSTAMTRTAPEDARLEKKPGAVPLEDDPKALEEMTSQDVEINRGKPVLRRDAYGNLVTDYI